MGKRKAGSRRYREDYTSTVVVLVVRGGDKIGYINEGSKGVRDNAGGASVQRYHSVRGIAEGEGGQKEVAVYGIKVERFDAYCLIKDGLDG